MFLKGDKRTKGEVSEYEGIDIEWIRGKRAIMTIFKDGEREEEVALYELRTREEMHKLMVEKGFQKKTAEQKVAATIVEHREKQMQQIENGSLAENSTFGLYFVVMGSVLGR
jgi:hypothetical protein